MIQYYVLQGVQYLDGDVFLEGSPRSLSEVICFH